MKGFGMVRAVAAGFWPQAAQRLRYPPAARPRLTQLANCRCASTARAATPRRGSPGNAHSPDREVWN